MVSWFRRFLLPGIVFQSMCIAGGYGTGRELVEFFMLYGPRGGLLGMLPATLLVSVGCAIAYELGRLTHTYDYRSFLRQLLGPAWVLYEGAYLLTILLVLAVVASATGAVFDETFGLPAILGTVLLLVVVAFLAFKGTRLIEGVLASWSFVLYAVYVAVFLLSLHAFGPYIREALEKWPAEPGWLMTGARYGALQLALVPAVLFSTTYLTSRRDAIVAGLLTGPILMIPALMFFTAMLGYFPEIVERPVPVNFILEQLGSPLLMWVFPVVLMGTFIETGTGMIHAFNERVAGSLAAIGRTLPQLLRPVIAIGMLLCALLLSRWGIIELIAVGYQAMTWVFIGVFVLPLLTVGAWKILRSSGIRR